MIAVVRWTPIGATLQTPQETWDETVKVLGHAGDFGAARTLSTALLAASGPEHARRVTLDPDTARAAQDAARRTM